MRKKILLYAGIFALAFLCACNKEEGREKKIMTPTPIPEATVAPTSTPRPTPTPSEDDIRDAYINSLEAIDWTELDCQIDEETSRRNSNLLNYGYLTYDAQGNIYFIDCNTGVFYVSDYNGENKRFIAEDKEGFGFLQLSGGWLYYMTHNGATKRVHLETGEIEQLSEEYTGSFVIEGGKLYKDNGYVYDLEGKNGEQMPGHEETGFGIQSQGTDFWIGSARGKYKTYNEFYILKYDGKELKVLKQRGGLPLLAGHYLSTNHPETNLRRIWDLETKEEIDLRVWTDQSVVSDGKVFYYKETKVFDPTLEEGELSPGLDTCIYHWDGEKTEAIWMIESDNLYEMYLTPTALYCTPQMKIDEKSGYHLLYYILETGETGVIY